MLRQHDAEDDDEEYGHNQEIEMIEGYSQAVTEEAIIVHAVVDEEELQIIIFKVRQDKTDFFLVYFISITN